MFGCLSQEKKRNRARKYLQEEHEFDAQEAEAVAAEWQVGGFTYLYNGTTECELRHKDLTAEWNEAGVSDVNLARQAREDYEAQQNQTNSTG